MLRHLRSIALLTVLTIGVSAVAYPLAILAVGQVAFPHTANGSIVSGPDGKPVGSSQIAQEFKGDEWFRPRPSAVGYNAAGSGGSNLGAVKLRERVEGELANWPSDAGPLPADAITASGSGLDPHITEANARVQLPRVLAGWAKRTGKPAPEVRAVIEAALSTSAFRPLFGVVGQEPIVNVLELHLQLATRFSP
jgi:potassium-transporting ATPase KdpC subunit